MLMVEVDTYLVEAEIYQLQKCLRTTTDAILKIDQTNEWLQTQEWKEKEVLCQNLEDLVRELEQSRKSLISLADMAENAVGEYKRTESTIVGNGKGKTDLHERR